MINLGPGSQVYYDKKEAEINYPGESYVLVAAFDTEGKARYHWQLALENPYMALLRRIDALEKKVESLLGKDQCGVCKEFGNRCKCC